LIALGRQLRLPVDGPGMEQAAAVQLVRNWLNGCDKRWLLLCDNADKMEPRDLRASLPTSSQGRILITSRNPNWRKLGGVLRLDVFTPTEATAFWQERLRLNQPAGLDQSRRLVQSELDQLAHELGYLPLALEQAAAYIDQNQASAADYLRLFQTRRRELWATIEPPDDYHATIATTWDIGFAEARQTAGAANLLHLCCFLAPAEIPLDLLVDQAEALPDELAAILTDPLARNAALTTLERYALLTLAHRQQGLLVAAGNPKQIEGVADLVRPDLVFVNRQPGTGTRVWLEQQLGRLGLDLAGVNQYGRIAHTHHEVAQTIVAGQADVGLGILAAAHLTGLDFIPLFEERYDLVLPTDSINEPLLQPLFDLMQTAVFRQAVQQLAGYDVTQTGSQQVVGSG
jgi:molybdate-binding protein